VPVYDREVILECAQALMLRIALDRPPAGDDRPL
jgi:hypothetical protein